MRNKIILMSILVSLISGCSREGLINYLIDLPITERCDLLAKKEKNGSITPEESTELRHIRDEMRYNSIIRKVASTGWATKEEEAFALQYLSEKEARETLKINQSQLNL